jgi:hypothetical protein
MPPRDCFGRKKLPRNDKLRKTDARSRHPDSYRDELTTNHSTIHTQQSLPS